MLLVSESEWLSPSAPNPKTRVHNITWSQNAVPMVVVVVTKQKVIKLW